MMLELIWTHTRLFLLLLLLPVNVLFGRFVPPDRGVRDRPSPLSNIFKQAFHEFGIFQFLGDIFNLT